MDGTAPSISAAAASTKAFAAIRGPRQPSCEGSRWPSGAGSASSPATAWRRRDLLESFRNHNDSALATMDRALALLRATHEHAGIARLESRRSDILQASGRLGEAKVALGQVLAHATISKNLQRLSNAYGGMGMLALRVGDLTTAADYFGRAAALNDSLGLTEAKLIAEANQRRGPGGLG